MKFVTFLPTAGKRPRLGCQHTNRIVDLVPLAAVQGQRLPSTLEELISEDALAIARFVLSATLPDLLLRHSFPVDTVRLLPPLSRPGKILCSGINYHSHLRENPSARIPKEPFFFAKMPSTVIGPGEFIILPPRSKQVDYEVEFAIVIGRTLRRASEAEVMPALFGYTILHDVSARDVQFKDNQITLGKNFDTFTPLGPCIVTSDELPDPAKLTLRSRVNGELRQDGSTSDWIFPLPRLLASLSHVMTLEPGDVVSTGTPAGVGLFRQPPVWLKAGDIVELEIEGIGKLVNPVTE